MTTRKTATHFQALRVGAGWSSGGAKAVFSRLRIHAPKLLALLALPLLGGCNDMWQQPKYRPLEPSRFWDDGTSARPLVPGTVAREDPRTLTPFDTGRVAAPALPVTRTAMTNTQLATQFPLPVTKELLERGQQRYDIYCSMCHGYSGYGNGVVVQRGFPPPPSFHGQMLRSAPVGHIFDVITNGHGAMYAYADRVKPADRWAIAAYIRALQRSQNATIDDVPQEERAAMK